MTFVHIHDSIHPSCMLVAPRDIIPSKPTKPIPLPTPKRLTRLVFTLLLRSLALAYRSMSCRRRILARLNTRIPPSTALDVALSPAIRRRCRYAAARRTFLFGARGFDRGSELVVVLLALQVCSALPVCSRALGAVGVDGFFRKVVGAAAGDYEDAPAVPVGACVSRGLREGGGGLYQTERICGMMSAMVGRGS